MKKQLSNQMNSKSVLSFLVIFFVSFLFLTSIFLNDLGIGKERKIVMPWNRVSCDFKGNNLKMGQTTIVECTKCSCLENGELSCQENICEDNQSLILKGVISRIESPIADENYNHKISLEKPFLDELNSQGSTEVSSFIVVPGGDEVSRDIDLKLNQEVTIEGKLEWGVADTRILKVLKID